MSKINDDFNETYTNSSYKYSCRGGQTKPII